MTRRGSSLVLFVLGAPQNRRLDAASTTQCGVKAFQGSEGLVADDVLWCSANFEIFSTAVAVSPQLMGMSGLLISKNPSQKCIECLLSRHKFGLRACKADARISFTESCCDRRGVDLLL